jgi:hypothetical protein
MIDTTQERPIPLTDLPAEAIPGRSGKPVHQATISLWHRKGLRGVKLETVLVGSRRCTSLEALDRFYQAVSKAKDPNPRGNAFRAAPAPPRTPHQRSKDVQQAVKTLERSGVLTPKPSKTSKPRKRGG